MLRKQIGAALIAVACCAAQSTATEKFEVASIRINPDSKLSCGPDTRGCAKPGAYGGAIYTTSNVPLDLLIELAYGVDQNQLSGTERLPSDRYDVSAKPASGTLSYERLKPMLQSLLEERFG